MPVRFKNPLVVVTDVERSLRFYHDILGLEIAEARTNFVLFENGFAIHDGASLTASVNALSDESRILNGPAAYYFEASDLDQEYGRLVPLVTILHGIRRLDWGGRVFRILDPDGHVLEIGEAAKV